MNRTALACLLAASLATPALVQESVAATTTEVTGTLRVIVSDRFESRKSTLSYELRDGKTGSRLKLVLPRSPRFVGGTDELVTVRGELLDGHRLRLDAGSVRTLEAAAKHANARFASPSGAFTSAVESAPAKRRALVMVAKFQDAAPSCGTAAIDAALFSDPAQGSVDALYQEMSLGRVGFAGNVIGPFLVDDTATGRCDLNGWTAALDERATAAGVDLSAYDHRVYVFPGASSCSTGMGTVGGAPGLVWIEACDLPDAFAHELGHNLGMNHASSSGGEYDDVSDVMGYSGVGLRQVNAPHQEQMGWRDAAAAQAISASGTYAIAPLELDATQAAAPQTLKIAIPGSTNQYYLSYRRPVGFDANLDSSYYALNVHRYAGNGARTYLLGTYADGQSFVDTASGITVTALSHGTSVLNVAVQFAAAPPPPTCTRGAPTVVIGPSSQSADAGSQATFTVSLANTDDANCAASTFVLDAGALPAGWSASASPSSATLAPGQSTTSAFTVSVPSSAGTGTYAVGVTTADAAVAAHTSSAGASVDAQATPPPDTTPPSTPEGLVVTPKRKVHDMVLTWSASSDDVGVTRYRVWRDGAIVGSSVDTRFVDQTVTDTALHAYQVTARDAAGNESTPSSAVSASLGSGSGGGGGGGGGGGKPH